MTTINEVQAYKAQSKRDEEVPTTVIFVNGEQPDWTGMWDQAHAMFANAEEIEAALFASIPGSLYDQLLARMLARKATTLVVPYAQALVIPSLDDTSGAAQELKETRQRFDAYIERTQALEHAVCHDERMVHDGVIEGTLESIWEHILRAFNPPPDDLKDDRALLVWLESRRKNWLDEIERIISGDHHVCIEVHLHAGSDESPYANAAAELKWLEASNGCLGWSSSQAPLGHGGVTVYYDPLKGKVE